MIPTGRYDATPTQCAFGYTKVKGTPYVRVQFRIDEGPVAGQTVEWNGYFTERTEERTIRALQLLGWGDDLHDFSGCVNPVSITVEHENGQDGNTYARVAWVNARGSMPRESSEVAPDFAARMRAKAAAVRAGDGQGRPRGATPQPPPAVNGRANMASPLGDDDIPF